MQSNQAVVSSAVQCLARTNGLPASLPKKDQYKCRRSYSRASLVTRHRQNLEADITVSLESMTTEFSYSMKSGRSVSTRKSWPDHATLVSHAFI